MKFKMAKRVITIGWSTANTMLGAVFSVLLSVEVIRLCSKELWGNMVEVLLWFGLASHLLNFANDSFLLREFSLMPKSISENWAKSLQSRALLFPFVSLVLFCLPIELQLKFLLFAFLAANFLYRSYDVVILFKRQFTVPVILETAGFIFIASYILLDRKNTSLNRLVSAFTAAELCKAIIIFFLFNKEFKMLSVKFNTTYFSLAFPFFLLEITGLLQSKTDLICVTSLLSKDKIAQYQVYINFLLLVQSAAGFVIAPFIRNIYRMKKKSIEKLSWRYFGFGIMLAFGSVFFVNFFLTYFYHFSIPLCTLITGAFFIIPIFYYTIVIYNLFKLNKQKSVVILNIVGIGISAILNLILIPLSKDGISGAILAIAITQWVLLLIYCVIQKKLTTAF